MSPAPPIDVARNGYTDRAMMFLTADTSRAVFSICCVTECKPISQGTSHR